jgi:hypothetical protein
MSWLTLEGSKVSKEIEMAFFSCESGGEGGFDSDKMGDFFGPGHVDQSVRQAIQACWMALPKASRTPDEVEHHIRRLVDRALKDFRDDAKAFGRA